MTALRTAELNDRSERNKACVARTHDEDAGPNPVARRPRGFPAVAGHVHPGVHGVVVLTGTLTVYDQKCQRVDYGPGDTYLGGADPHLVRNNSAENVRLVVTRVYERLAPMGSGMSVAPPAGCDAR